MIRIVRHIQDLREDEKGAVVALGNFDGIHLGHTRLLQRAKEIADKEGRKLVIMSFHPHPLTFFKGIQNVQIQGLRDKLEILNNIGVDIVFLQKFNAKFAALGALEFLQNFLLGGLRVGHIVAGHDFIFGKNRSGSVEFLKEQSLSSGFSLTQLSVQTHSETTEVFSSSKVRSYLDAGNINKANELLGRSYSVIGRVIPGRQAGRDIGFKTANMSLPSLYQMKYGVYAAHASVHGKRYKAVVNFGVRPSFNLGDGAIFEAHIFDLDEDIYGKYLKLEFIEFLRPEKKFSNISELTKQIEHDSKNAKSILEN